MKFKADLISNVLHNQGNSVENIVRSISPTERVSIAQGYGVDEKVPMRFLSYAVPVLRLASQFSKVTTIEFYFATHGVSRANGKYFGENASIMKKHLDAYIQAYHPKLVGQVRILDDIPLNGETEKVIEYLFEKAKGISQSSNQIAQFIAKRGGDNALRYMVEHLLYMRDPFLIEGQPNKTMLVPGMSTEHEHVIMVGGPAEKIFYDLRQSILQKCGFHTKWKSHQIFTPIGDPPTYHVHDGEPIMDQNLPESASRLLYGLQVLNSEYGKQRNLIRDYTSLLQDIAGVEKFKLPHEADCATLEQGYTELKKFLSNV